MKLIIENDSFYTDVNHYERQTQGYNIMDCPMAITDW